MGYPHETIEIPGIWPVIAHELESTAIRSADSDELARGLIGGEARRGHVCATAWVFNEDLSKLLLLQHPNIGWSNPGGHVEINESSATAASRELYEETGLGLKVFRTYPLVVHPSAATTPTPHIHWNIAWAFQTSQEEVLIFEENKEVRWFDVTDLPTGASDLVDTTKAIKDHLTRF